MEDLLRRLPGVLETQVGYTGGTVREATYKEVKTGRSGHAETVQILFDPRVISFEKILLTFFTLHDPTTADRQGNDVGSQYRSEIFYESEDQRRVAEAVIARVDRSGKWGGAVVTRLEKLGEFWRAEEDHQDYLEKNPGGYTCHFIRRITFD
jgi:methionine-S-sulfoxide reductase